MSMVRKDTEIRLGDLKLGGELHVPGRAAGVVLFAHGSGSSRHSPRNQFVAGHLRESGLGTLLFDLLTAAEERAETHTGHLRFDIELLASRLEAVTRWVISEDTVRGQKLGYFGASTGAAAALMAAAQLPDSIQAVVSRGGRPDLAGESLGRVRAPTVLIVGGEDEQVLALNEAASARMRCERELRIIPGATHLFEEPGALEQVARMAAAWFTRHFENPSRRG